MAHFAELDNNNIVLRTIVIDNNDILDNNGIESEEIGIAFCKSLFGQDTNWKQTSFNNNFRGHFAGVNDVYDSEKDEFVPGVRGEIVQDEEIIDAEIIQNELN